MLFKTSIFISFFFFFGILAPVHATGPCPLNSADVHAICAASQKWLQSGGDQGGLQDCVNHCANGALVARPNCDADTTACLVRADACFIADFDQAFLIATGQSLLAQYTLNQLKPSFAVMCKTHPRWPNFPVSYEPINTCSSPAEFWPNCTD